EPQISGFVAQVARLHSRNMASYNFFSHVGVDGKRVDSRANSTGVSWRSIGENIAYNRGFGSPAESVVNQWMRSTAHRENLLSGGWKESGIGISITSDGRYYFTQVFIKK
ncbi:MAG: CAP domain-containing protein, partial [Pyrinomonadaceae bacterium]